MYTIEIQNTRATSSTTDLVNYLDTILLDPTEPMLGADGQTLSVLLGSTRNLVLDAGPAYANKDYWIWVNFSGTFPGFNMSGVNVPLNYDMLVELCLTYPGFPDASFVGQLDGSGQGTASLSYKPKSGFIGFTLYFAYVVLSPGGGPPILAASNPINMTVTMFY